MVFGVQVAVRQNLLMASLSDFGLKMIMSHSSQFSLKKLVCIQDLFSVRRMVIEKSVALLHIMWMSINDCSRVRVSTASPSNV